ncbi:MAG: hypothetical protein FVQ77_16285 [Cytophagales bacterium]|nr:hypothetical protein [Cytophagales bacterium]
MEKKTLLKNILIELDNIPVNYLKNLYEIIHTFRIYVPQKQIDIDDEKEQYNDLIWDELIDEIYQNREDNNKRLNSEINNLF